MANPFDQFDTPATAANPFDQFDKPEKPTGLIRKIADKGLGFASGAVGATKAIADAAGAGNAVSGALGDANEFVNDYLSPEAKADQQEQAAIMAGASGKGVWEGVKAGAKAFGVAPVQTAVQGLGSIVPVLAGGLAGLPGAAATGIAIGAGTAKGAIYDRIKKEGGTEEQATKAQEYSGANTDQIALGGALGVADALTGVSRIAGGMVKNALGQPVKQAATNAVEHGLIRKAGMGVLGEMPLEAAQGGQEQVAANIAAQRAGYQAGTWDNVASNATLEALASAGPGAIFGALERGPIASLANPPAADPAAPAAPVAPVPQLGNTPEPMLSFADGTVARKSDFDAYVNSLPPDQQAAALAKVMGLAPQPVKPSEAMGLDPAAGPLSTAAVVAVDTGIHEGIKLDEANAADQAAYEQATNQQAQQAKQQDTIDKPITTGPIAEAAMSDDDKRAVLYSNQPVMDGGTKFKGTQDGDILNGMSAPYSTYTAAARRANMEGKDWQPVKIAENQFVARRKDANGTGNSTQPGAATGAPVPATDTAGTVGTGSVTNAGSATDTTRTNPADVVPSAGLPGGSVDGALNEQNPQTPTLPAPTPAPGEAPQAVAGNAAPAAGLPAAGAGAVEGTGVENSAPAGNVASKPTSTDTSFTGKLIPDMTDDELQRAVVHYGPDHKRTPKLLAAIAKRKNSQPQGSSNAKSTEAVQDQAQQPQAPTAGVAPSSPESVSAQGDGLNDHIRSLRSKAHEGIMQGGPRGDVRLNVQGKNLYVPFDVAVDEAKSAVAIGMKPVPFQVSNTLDVGIGDTDRIIAALNEPTAKTVTPQLPPAAPVSNMQTADAPSEPRLEEAKALLVAQKKATGNAVAEAKVRKQLRDLAGQVQADSKTAMALDTAATRLGMGEGKLKGLEFATPVAKDNGQDDWTVIGKNKDGKTIVADKLGVRSYVENGIRVTETVSMRPTRNGMVMSTEHKGEYLSVEEIAKDAQAQADGMFQSKSDKAAIEAAATADNEPKVSLGDKAPGDTLLMGNGNTYSIDGIDATKNKIRLLRNPNMLSERSVLMGQTDFDRLVADDKETRAETLKANLAAKTGQNDELDAEMRSYEAKAGKPTGPTVVINKLGPDGLTDAERAAGKPSYADAPAKPDPLTDKEKAAKAKMFNALGKLAALAGKNTRMNWTQEEEQQILPIVIELFDGAMELGAVTFQKAVRYVREFIAGGIDQETADSIPFETLQGAYIATSGRHKDKPVTTKRNVAAFDSLEELENSVEEADTDAKDTQNATRQLDSTGQGPLEGVSTDSVQGTPAVGQTAASPDGRSGANPEGTGNTDGTGVPILGGLGNGSGGLPVPARGSRGKRGSTQQPGVSGNAPVSQGNGSVDTSGGTGGLIPVNPAPNAAPIAAPAFDPQDFTIEDDFALGEGGAKAKFKGNIAAIRLIAQLDTEQRGATPSEQKVLAAYVGWGGLAQAFDQNNSDWSKEYAELKGLMSEDDYADARVSTRYAHYTSREIIQDGIYAALSHFGFHGGRALEGGAGVGNFIGLMPTAMRSASRFTAIEREPFSAKIARHLYPKQNIQEADFTEFVGNDDFYDVAVGNPPFASDPQVDRSGRKHLSGLSLHNYFFAKEVDMLREGGILAQVVTNSFMDATTDTARQYIADKTKFLGAIRLPNNAFSKNAGTEVTTDLIFLQKRPESEWGGKAAKADAKQWLGVGKFEDAEGRTVALNQYFIDNPSMMLGKFGAYGTMYRGESPALVQKPGQDTAALLKEAVAKLPSGVYVDRVITNTASIQDALIKTLSTPSVHEGGYFEEDGKLFQRIKDIAGEARGMEITPETMWTAKTKLGAAGFARIKSLSSMRETVRALLAAELSNDPKMTALRATLNTQYDAYDKEHGRINDPGTLRVFDDDPDFPLLASLEYGYTPAIGVAAAKSMGIKAVPSKATKGPIFAQRVIESRQQVAKVETPADALAVSMAERGKLDSAYISELLGRDSDEVLQELASGDKPLLFKDPATGEYALRDAYLSGNVRAKLVQAKQAGMFNNIKALEEVQPADVGSHEIVARIGSPWVPESVYMDFAKTLFGDGTTSSIKYVKETAGYGAYITAGNSTANTNTWGTADYPGTAILAALLNNKPVKVTYKDADGNIRTDTEATEKANIKAQEIRNKFQDWLFTDGERAELLGRAYNDTNNNYVTREFDGAMMTFPGKVPDSIVKFRRHQRNSAARIVQDRTALLDQVVGSGKTYTIIAAAMELRRTGLAKKPMIAVPNHLVKQWAADFYKLYPGANILTATKKDFEKVNRRKFLAKIATGDWDAVIIAHSSFGFIKPSPDFEQKFNGEQIANIIKTIQQVEAGDGDKQQKKRTVKQLEGIKERLENRIKALRDKPMDSLLDFGELGVDQLFVDEAHMFKNLMFTTKMQNIAGLGDSTGSQRAYDMYVKTNQIYSQNGRGQGVVFATGTPVSNSLAEMYHMMRYLMPAQMKEMGFESFDAWANTFASVEQVWMQKASGDGFKAQNRMSNFVNTPELLKIFDQVSDTVTMDDIKKAFAEENNGAEFPLPKLKGGKRTPVSLVKSAGQNAYMADIADRAKILEQRKGPPLKGEDNILVIMSDARKAAMDIRLVDPNVMEREAGGRIDRSSQEIFDRYQQYDAVKGTQIVFSDLGTPLKSAKKELAEYQALQQRIQDGSGEVLMQRASMGDEAAQEKIDDAEDAQEELDAKGRDWLGAMQAAERGFSVYDDLKLALVERGIPENEIAFIHDYNTDEQKAGLFRKMNSGQIRVLMGSTPKLGAGTNVQERLVALHHLDVPWKPSDVEQREGRIIRQGNKLDATIPDFEVEVLAYVTQDTLDMRMWQVQETKLRMINQLRTRKIDRNIENAFEDLELSAGEMQAAATGNMDLLREIQIKGEVKKLEQRKRAFDAQKSDLQNRKKSNAQKLATLPAKIETSKPMADATDQYKQVLAEQEGKFTATIDGKEYTSAKEAGDLLLSMVDAHVYMQKQADGKYGGPTLNQTEAIAENSKPQAPGFHVWTKRPVPLDVNLNGEQYISRDKLLEAFADIRGDRDPIAWVTDGKTLIRRSVIEGAIRQSVADAIAEEQSKDIGALGPFKVSVEGYSSRMEKVIDVALTVNGQTISNARGLGKADENSAQNNVRSIINMAENLAIGARQQHEYEKRQLQQALKEKAELDSTETQGEWPDQGKLDDMRKKYQDVLNRLAGAKSDATKAPPPLKAERMPPVDGAMFSARDSAPEKQLPLDQIERLVKSALRGVKNAPTVRVVASPEAIGLTAPVDTVPSGVTMTNGDIYVFQSGIGSALEVDMVVFHEVFHKGIQNVLPTADYVGAMQDIAKHDAKVREYAGIWSDSKAGKAAMGELAQKYSGKALADQYEALATEEGLAMIAEDLKAKRQMGTKDMRVRRLVSWLAKLADKLGMTRLANSLRAMSYSEAEKFVISAIEKSGGNGTGGIKFSGKNAAQTDTAAFKAWFGDSKVVDAQGAPLVVYHGSPSGEITEFSNGGKGGGNKGFYFTRKSGLAQQYANGTYPKNMDKGGAVYPVYLSIQNPFVIQRAKTSFLSELVNRILPGGADRRSMESDRLSASMYLSDAAIAGYKAQGYDGIINEAWNEIVAFNPSQVKSAIGNNGDFDGTNPDIRFRMADTLNDAANNVRGVKLAAGYQVSDLIDSVPGKLNWWHKTVGTQYNLARRSKSFKRVFDAVQSFLNDVSYFATEAADLAPNILPKLETWKDIGKSPLSAADTKAISAPIFEGTLVWARDESGKPVRIETLEAAAAKLTTDQKAQRLLRGNHISDGVLRMWRGLPIDQYEAMIASKFERDMLKAGIVFTDAELKSLFKLTDAQIPLYREFRAATDKSLTNLAIADMIRFGGEDVEQIRDAVLESKTVTEAADTMAEYLRSLANMDDARSTVLMDTADKMIDKGDKAADLMKRGYAPLSRFGQYTLDVVAENGERVYFGMFENRFEAAKMMRQMRDQFPGATISQGTVSEEQYKMFSGVSPETLELFGDMLGLETSGDGAANEAFQVYLKRAKSSRSAMKRLIQRKGIAGFNEDAGRVLAGFVYSNARQTASSLHMGEMTKAAADRDAFRNQGELQDAAVKLVDYIKNPQEEAQAFRGLLFAQYIGGSIASAMVNMTQPLTMTFPWLSQFGGVTSAAKQMAAAMKDSGKKLTGNAQLDAALKRAEEDGTVSPQEVHQLMQQASGGGVLRSGDGTTAGNALATANNTLSRITLAWGKLFSAAEQFNRRVTFIAAYRTAMEQGMKDPDAFARRAVNETQGIYNKGNKPAWARGAIGGTLFTFKQYSISYVEMLQRMSKNGPEGKKAALLALGVLFLMAGAGGMPGADDLDDLISGAMQSMGYNFDSKTKRKAFFVELFGEDMAQFMERGVSGLPGVPIDVSGRMGLGNLIPGTGLFTKKQDHTRDVAEFAGPAGDLIKRTFDAAGKLITGDVGGAVKSIAPKALQNAEQSYDMMNMGMYRDAKGMKVLDTDGYDAMMKLIGFQPNDVKRAQDASFEVQRMVGLNRITESGIANEWALGLFEKDPTKVQEARDKLAAWNEANPESRIAINYRQIMQRVRNMNQTKQERIAKTSPKEIRAAVRAELEASR